ncbi:MAG: response regulator [Candidatus Heimdallarchaeota archaeon]|nr:response regulator [Candidatus Heimdallarchaeota archaeon]
MRKLILLAEDNQDDIILTQRAFNKSNILNELIVVHDGEEALDFLFGKGKYEDRDTKKLPELVLLDLKMPKIDGLEVLKKMREHPLTKHIPVVILTTSQEESDMIKSYCYGANSYIIKPVDFNQFVNAVKQLGLYWLVLNKRPKIESCLED